MARTRVSYDPPGAAKLPAGSQTKLSGGSAPHRANPGGGSANVNAKLSSGSAGLGNKSYTGSKENAFPGGFPAKLAMKKARAAKGARTVGDFERRG